MLATAETDDQITTVCYVYSRSVTLGTKAVISVGSSVVDSHV